MIVDIGKFSFKGVEIIYVDSSITGGHKYAKKKFINTDQQLVEDLGSEQYSHSIRGLVALISDEESYNKKRDRILAALNSPGAGTLIHPIHGTIHNAFVTTFTLIESTNAIGIGELNIDFEISNASGIPQSEFVTPSEILNNNKLVLAKSQDAIERLFDPDTKLLGVYASAKNKVAEIGNAFQSAVSFVGKTTSGINQLSNVIADFQRDVALLASSPERLSAAIVNVFNNINAVVATSAATFNAYVDFFEFGFLSDIQSPFNTEINNKRKKNNYALNYSMNVIALSGAYSAVSGKLYKTVDEINSDIETLENQYQFIRNNTSGDSDLLFELMNSRELILNYLDDLKQRTSRLITVDYYAISARALSYLYYGDDSEAYDIAKLNIGTGLIYTTPVQVFNNEA